ncbi:hypothetical protein ACO0LD_31605 [Undibacterium sp. Ji83W]|uniref:hypothetical protein n=1 Tax=Undibacterium sp. Ji83W TaxID=3413043 RepID=UPI003BF0BFA5
MLKELYYHPLMSAYTYFLHVARASRSGEINYRFTEKINKRIIAASDGEFPLEILDKMFDAKNAQGGLYIFREGISTNQGNAFGLFAQEMNAHS